MDWIDGSYWTVVNLAAGLARPVRRWLPEGVRLRLEAEIPEMPETPWIWLHAVSVGELLLAEGVLRFLLADGRRVHITTGTAAGVALLGKRLPDWDRGRGLLSGGAFPLDDIRGLKGFFKKPPGLFVALETEIWPNLIRELAKRDVPRVIINGRLTERSLGKGGPWLSRAASRLSLVVARDVASQEAFIKLGAPHVALGGNLKADIPPPKPLHAGWDQLRGAWENCPVLVAGNTIEGEEALMLDAWQAIRKVHAEVKLILAPRQPRRFQEVAALFETRSLPFFRASSYWPENEAPWRTREVLLLDTLGELSAAYAEGSLALVGGGWKGQGGHNPLEPVRWGLPTLIGPGFENFTDLVDPLLDAGLLQIVKSDALVGTIMEKMQSIALRPGKSEKNVKLPPSLRGTLERSCNLLTAFLPEKKL